MTSVTRYNIDLSHYSRDHREELESLIASDEWQDVLTSGLIEDVRLHRIQPAETRSFIDTVVDQLLEFNEGNVATLIAGGNSDKEELFSVLSTWPDNLHGKDPRLSFVGINLTAECNFKPKCRYCNQPWVPSTESLEDWRRIVAEVASNTTDGGPYLYMTGGEPLVLGEQLWGDNGLIRFATEHGAGVNVNTNATLLTPKVALHLIKAGLGKLHISLDTSEPGLQNYLFGGDFSATDRFDRVMRGIYNVQLARDIVGANYPVIHTNCVLTKENLDTFPLLFEFILEKHKQTADRQDAFYNDLFPHVIPVGGSNNDERLPSADEFRRFYTKIWPRVCEIWDNYQGDRGVVEDERGVLFGYFSNPSLRVEHEGGLEAYIDVSTKGEYGKLALSQDCYVWPTQIALTPDGNYHRCGAHAIRRCLSLGNMSEQGIFDSIRENIHTIELPQEQYCSGCALATLYINQAVEAKLNGKIEDMLNP